MEPLDVVLLVFEPLPFIRSRRMGFLSLIEPLPIEPLSIVPEVEAPLLIVPEVEVPDIVPVAPGVVVLGVVVLGVVWAKAALVLRAKAAARKIGAVFMEKEINGE